MWTFVHWCVGTAGRVQPLFYTVHGSQSLVIRYSRKTTHANTQPARLPILEQEEKNSRGQPAPPSPSDTPRAQPGSSRKTAPRSCLGASPTQLKKDEIHRNAVCIGRHRAPPGRSSRVRRVLTPLRGGRDPEPLHPAPTHPPTRPVPLLVARASIAHASRLAGADPSPPSQS